MPRLMTAWSRFAAPFVATAEPRPRSHAVPLMIPRPRHIAHLHLLGVLNTESYRFPAHHVVRILDAGCGSGRLLAYLARALPMFHPMLTFEFYGLDVHDRPSDDFGATVDELSHRAPSTPWAQRIVRIADDAAWPYPDGFFDIIVSNQVGEHVRDHRRFLGEIARCLAPGGFSANLFPLKHVVMEWHILVPFAHRIRNYDLLRAFILLGNRLGFGSARRKASARRQSLTDYCARQADYVLRYTSYISHRELLALATRQGLFASTRYTKEFYAQKLRQLLSRASVYEYARTRSILGDWLLVFLLRYVSGVTVLLEKGDPFEARYPRP